MDHIEEENNDLRTKLNKLQEAIVSPSGDAKSSAIARLVSENPAPKFQENSPPTPKTTITYKLSHGYDHEPYKPHHEVKEPYYDTYDFEYEEKGTYHEQKDSHHKTTVFHLC